MKQFLPLLLVLFYACSNPPESTISFASINGKINHSKNAIHPVGLFTNATRFGIEKPNHLVALDTNGNYRFEIPLKKPTEVRLQYGGYSKILYINPTEKLTFNKTVSFDVLPNQSVSPDYNLDTIIGPTADLSLKMNQFNQLFIDSFQVVLNATLSYAIPREFKNQRAEITKRIRHFTQTYIKENKVNNPVLVNWINNHTEYRIAMDYMKYAFKSHYSNNITPLLKEGLLDYYFDFLEEFPINNLNATASLNYQNYLQLYRKYLMAKLVQTTAYQDCKSLPNCNFYDLEVAEIVQHLKGETLDFSLMQQIDKYLTTNNARFLEYGFKSYLSAVKDSLLIQQIQTRKNYLYEERTFDYPDGVTCYQSNGTGEQILKEIAQKHQGRNTLLYFWNTQADLTLPFLSKSKRQSTWQVLDTLNFDLVLLAHHSTPNYWKDFIIEKGLIQDQWHLTDEQYHFFKNHFQNELKKHKSDSDIVYRDYENFILALDKEGSLMDSKLPAIPLIFLPNQIKWELAKKKN